MPDILITKQDDHWSSRVAPADRDRLRAYLDDCRLVCWDRRSVPGRRGVKFYKLVDGRVDEGTYNGFRRYHTSCNHCHGSDGLGSTFGPSLVNRLPEIEMFRRIVREGQTTGN